MAKWTTVNHKGAYFNLDAKRIVLAYILQPQKTISGYCGGVGVDWRDPATSMNQVSEHFEKISGVQLRHFVISFHPNELDDPEIANSIARKITNYLGQEYQAVYAVHEDTPHLNIHIVINSISYVDGHRYYGTRQEFYSLQSCMRMVLRQYGVGQLEYVSKKKADK